MNEQIKKAEYRVIGEVEEVLVKVPKESKSMQWKEGGMPVAGVPAHWANGKVFQRFQRAGLPNGRPVIFNSNFYGIEKNDLGRQIVADVTVLEKTTEREESYTMIDITKVRGGIARNEMRFYQGFQLSKKLISCAVIIEIQGTRFHICFVPSWLSAAKSVAA